MSTTEPNRQCVNCQHAEILHLYYPPAYSSDDGLPDFEGCFGEGAREHPTVLEDGDHHGDPVPVCHCDEFDPGDEDEGAIDYHPFRCGANCEVCSDR